MKKFVFLLLLPLILTACVRIRIERVERTAKNTETPTPEMLIVRRTYPTRYPTNTPEIHEVMYTITALAIPQRYPTSTPMGFDPVIIGDFRLDFLGYKLRTSITGTNYIELNYRFTNNSNKTTSFGYSISTDAYQDGVGMSFYIPGYSDTVTDIRPGMSINITDAFQLRTDTNNLNPLIELEFRPFLEVWQRPITRQIRLR